MAKIKETMTKDGKEVKYNVLDEYVGKDGIGYKKLCEILNIKYSGGSAKIKHINDISRHYNMEKEGVKYKIVSKKDGIVPLPKDIRTSKYYTNLETIILYLLQQEEDKEVTYWATTEALMLTNMVNDRNYLVGRHNVKGLSQALEIDKEYIRGFYDTSKKKLKDIFTNTLSGMENRGLIIYKECFMVRKTKIEIIYNEAGLPALDKKRNVQTIRTEVYTEATAEEEEVIIDITNKILDNMGFTNILHVLISNKRRAYIKEFNKELYRRLGADSCYKAHRIVRNNNIVRFVEETENEVARTNINNLTVQCMNDSKDKKLTKDKEDREILIDYLIKSYDSNSAVGELRHMIENCK